MARHVTDKQLDALQFIHDYTEKHGFPPSIRDYARAREMSTKGAYDHFVALIKKRMIERQTEKARTYLLTAMGRSALGLPSMKDSQIPVYDHPRQAATDTISSPKPGMFGDDTARLFAMKMPDDAMLNSGLRPGDVLVFRTTTLAHEAEIVAVEVDGQVAIRFYFTQHGRVCLKASNPMFQDTYPPAPRILGKLQGMIRVY